MSEPTEVNKGGEQWLMFSIFPGSQGLHIQAKAHPKVEEFFRSLGNGEAKSANLYNDRWFSVGTQVEGDVQLPIYNMVSTPATTGYKVDLPGSPLFITKGGDLDTMSANGQINLSFLRLKGISTGAGIEFGIRDVYPLGFRRELKARIGTSFRSLVMEHIKPVRISLIVSSQEF